MSDIRIIGYQPAHQRYFEQFNRQWIEEWFTMEPLDEYVLTHPEEAILQNGGAILMALYKGEVAGTVGLRKLDDKTVEFTKMAVGENYRRKGLAEALCYASFQKAAEMGMDQILLYSNTKNAGAIKLYEKVGFTHLVPEQGVYTRANVKMSISVKKALYALLEWRNTHSLV